MKKQSRLAEFETLKQLGEGGFGVAFKVRRLGNTYIADNKKYVLKRINISSLNKGAQRDAIKEADLLERLEHPYIVKYVESFIENKSLHIVMEYCGKGDLNRMLQKRKKKQLEESQVWKYFVQMCFGLEYLHSQKVLHRDIKTMNFFLTKDDQIRIGDLGVAKILASSSAFAHTMIGSPYYLSPELCEDKPYNAKSDIWALGCVLYELCELRHPFEATNEGALILKILRSKYPPLSEAYSVELRQLVEALLRKDYRQRPSVTQILKMPIVQKYVKMFDVHVPSNSVLSEKNDKFQDCLPISMKNLSAVRMNKNSLSATKNKYIKPKLSNLPRLKIQRIALFPFKKPISDIFVIRAPELRKYSVFEKPLSELLNIDCLQMLEFQQQTKEVREDLPHKSEEEMRTNERDSLQLFEYESYQDISFLYEESSIYIPTIESPDSKPDLFVCHSDRRKSSECSIPDDGSDEIYEEDLFQEHGNETDMMRKLENNVNDIEARKSDLTMKHQAKKKQILNAIGDKFDELYDFFNEKVQTEIDDNHQEEIDSFFSQYQAEAVLDMYHLVHLEMELESIEEELRVPR